MKEATQKKQDIYDAIEKYNDLIGDLENQRNKTQKKIHPKYNRVELIKKGVAEIEKEINTTTYSKQKEKELI